MRSTKLFLVLLGMTTALVAADPFVGTWKMNTAKTKYTTGTPPKTATVVISEKGEDLDVTIKGTRSDGSASLSHYTMPKKGGAGKIIESPYEGVTSKRPSAAQREVSYLKGGKVVYTSTPTLSADGKTMTAAVKGTDAAGKAIDGTIVYDKQ